MEIKLQCPIKQGTKVKKWFAHNTELKDLDDFFLCQSQGWNEMLRDYAGVFGLKGHNGLDIAYDDGTEVFAMHDGVLDFEQDEYKGLGAVVAAEGYKTILWHLKSFVGANRAVRRGELIGYGDNTGYSTGPHLHLGLKLLDLSGQTLNKDNGYWGFIDPTLYLIWWDMLTEQEIKQLQSLEGYSDPAGVIYWTGKTLEAYLLARLPDKIKTLQESL